MRAEYWDVFISYKSEDRPLAQELYDRLTAADFRVWFDQPALDRVCRWHEEIEAGCGSSRLILPVLTPRWADSDWCKYETYGGEAVVPLVFEGEFARVAPAALWRWQAMVEDLREATPETWHRLFRRLRQYLAEDPPQKEPRFHDLRLLVNPNFVGRERLLLELHEKLFPPPGTVLSDGLTFVLAGNGGVGKTSLARQYAEKFWRLYDDILWVSAADTALLPSAFARIATELRVAEGEDVDRNARLALKELTSGPRRLLILDNAEDKQSVLEWLPRSGKCHTLITSRFTDWLPTVRTVHVGVLDPKPAEEFLIRRSGLPDTESNRAAAGALAKNLGYLPLALELAAAHAETQQDTLENCLALLASPGTHQRARLLAEHHEGATEYPESVARTWLVTVAKLSPPALAVLRLLSFVAPDPLPRSVLVGAGDVLATAAGDEGAEPLDAQALGEVLAELRRYSLIELAPAGGPLTIHRLLQAVQEDGLREAEQAEWTRRALVALGRAFPQANHRNWHVCEALVPHALAVSGHAARHKVLAREAGLLPGLVGSFFQLRGQMSASLAPMEQATVAFERLAAADPGNAAWQRDLAVSHIKLGDVRRAQGDLPGALREYEADLDIAQRLAVADPGNAAWQYDLGVSHERIGTVRQAQGDLAGAVQAFQTKHSIIERLAVANPGNAEWQRDLSVSHNKLGDVRVAQGGPAGGPDRLPGQPRHPRAPGGRRPRQRTVAARPLRQP